MRARPSLLNALCAAVMIVCFVIGAVLANHQHRHLTQFSIGELAEEYTEVTDHSIKHYEVKYSFLHEGKQYSGTDTLDTLPAGAECKVYYDPRDPSINSLKQDPVNESITGMLMFFLIAGALMYATFPVYLNSALPEGTQVHEGSIGDSQGEHFVMSGGKYSSGMYVAFGFFGQVAGLSAIISTALNAAVPIYLVRDLVSGFVAACVTVFTLAVYWDRFKVNSVYISQYCSGCVNLSILYVPIVSILYANYRGFRKLHGR